MNNKKLSFLRRMLLGTTIGLAGIIGCDGGNGVVDRDSPKIVFASLEDSSKIKVIENGSDEYRLINNPSSDKCSEQYPAWSPDGLKIAFISDNDLYTANADGSGLKRLTASIQNELYPSWKPGGERIAFSTNMGIYSISSENGDLENYPNGLDLQQIVSTSVGNDSSPKYLNENEIVFSSNRDGSNDIFIANADGTNVKKLIESSSYNERFPSCSPDGLKIAFISDMGEKGNYDLYTANADGSDLQQLTDSIQNELYPSWKPDGKRIAFSTNMGVSIDWDNEIYSISSENGDLENYPNGLDLQQITDSIYTSTQPDWCPIE